MKRYLLIISLISLAACNNAPKPATTSNGLPANLVNNPATANGVDNKALAEKPTMDFKDTVYNFGVVKEGETVEHDFTFTNNGKSPLIITGAAGSCGCTVPDYPHDPIDPGKTMDIKVTFNSTGKFGHQEKSVTIRTNTLNSIHMLYIKADMSIDKK